MDAQLVLDGHAAQVIARAKAPIRVHKELRHNEQRNALGACRCARRAGQHKVDDVLGAVVLAPGDEDLMALDPVGAVRLRLGLCLQRAHVRPRLRLGQVHGGCPFAGHDPGKVRLLLLVRCVRLDRLDRAERQHRAQREGQVRARQTLLHRQRHCKWHALPAMVRTGRNGPPACLHIAFVSLLKPRRQRHHAIVPLCALLVSHPVERGPDFLRKLSGFIHNRGDQIGTDIAKSGKTRQFFSICNDFENKLLFPDRSLVGHRNFLLRWTGTTHKQ